MKNIINIEDTEYIKLSKYKELEEKKKPKDRIVKTQLKLNEYSITDPSNICGIFPILKRGCGEIGSIESEIGYFREYPIETLNYTSENYDGELVLEINGSRYSKKYFDGFRKMAGIWFNDYPKTFMRYDKKNEKWLKGNPILFLFGENLTFILAPRIDYDCESEIENSEFAKTKKSDFAFQEKVE